jgi:serine/threonine-protein kinase
VSDDKIPPREEPRTVFSPGTLPPAPSAPPSQPEPQQAEPLQPQTEPPQQPGPGAGIQTGFAPGGLLAGGPPRQVQVGDVLNHLYQVVRHIDRGGMGEVFEGVNINQDDERVAIKVILPHLAADPNVLAMFRKEARTLTRLSHPALVQYRTLAQEPQLGVFYIVTEFIDGTNLSKILGQVEATPEQLRALMRRLAEGLAAAHALGAIHRDMSPDNIMLEAGRLDRAKIIDFGIAKDLDAGSQTIVGDGFAGKLNYVAPEQLGDFGRQVGEWSDVYSLALTMLAIVNKRDVDMGGTLVDAVDKRRAGPDLSSVPEPLRPVFAQMLRPNPADRLRSMQEVIAALDGRGMVQQAPPAPPSEKARKVKPPRLVADKAREEGGQRKLALYGGIAAAVVLLAGVGYFATRSGGGDTAPIATSPQASGTVATGDPTGTAQAALAAGLPGIGCSWLDVTDLSAKGSDIDAAFRGVSGKPGDAQGSIGQLLSAKGLRAANLDFSDVSPIDSGSCSAIDAFRAIRAEGQSHIASAQRKYEMDVLPPESDQHGKLGASAVVELNLAGVQGDVALLGLEDNGHVQQFVKTRSDLGAPTRPDFYRIPTDTTHQGWSGVVLISGKGPFNLGLPEADPGPLPAGWADRFLAQAKANGWKAEMVWYKLADELPNKAS